MKRILMVVMLLVLLSTVVPIYAQGSPVASVNTGALNVRTGPGMQYGSIASLPFGFGVQMIGRNTRGDWILIQLTNGVTGWVNQGYLFTQYPTHSLPVTENPVAATVTPTATVTGVVTGNLRTGAGPNDAIITTVPLGTSVLLLGRSFDSKWAKIQLGNGTVGWIEAYALTGTVPVRSLALADGSVFVPNAPIWPGTSGGTTTGSLQIYVVQRGDTLWGIANRFGVNLYDIARLNNITDVNRIYADQRLMIPA